MWKTLRVYAHSNASTTITKPMDFLYNKLEHTLGARQMPDGLQKHGRYRLEHYPHRGYCENYKAGV